MEPSTQLEERIWRLFSRGCVEHHLLEDGDRILVALSGGKDSLELGRMMARRARIFKPSIQVEAAHVIMDNIPYETDRTYLQEFCQECGIPLHILHTRFEERENSRKPRCFLCSWSRRKALLEFARDNQFNKIALGHHMDDILVTLLMNMTYEGSLQTMKPSLRMEHYPITLIRPLCLVPEANIRRLATLLGFQKQKTLCPYEQVTRRTDMKKILTQLEQLNPEARYSMWNAITSKKHLNNGTSTNE